MKLKLKKGVKVVKTEKGYRFSYEPTQFWEKPRKVMSRQVPELLGYNSFNSAGQAILGRMGLLEKVDIDFYWLVRGEVAEHYVNEHLKQIYALRNVELKTQTHTTAGEGFDMFKDNKKFGGVIDIQVIEPKEIIVEVKSKSEKAKTFIIDRGQIPQAELWQGLALTKLMGKDTLLMAYAFLKEEAENKLRKSVKDALELGVPNEEIIKTAIEDVSMHDFDYHYKTFNLQDYNIEDDMEKAYKLYYDTTNGFQYDFEIPKALFYDNDIEDIEKQIVAEKKSKAEYSEAFVKLFELKTSEILSHKYTPYEDIDEWGEIKQLVDYKELKDKINEILKEIKGEN